MSYSLSVSGHKDTQSPDESIAFEKETVAKAKAFIDSLEGVTSASGTFGSLGSVNLLEPTGEGPVAPESG
jgi:hypothetical protein